MSRIRVIHVITRFDKGGSAENTYLTCMGLDPELYDVRLVIGPSDESAMGPEETACVEENLARLRARGVKILTLAGLVRRVSPVKDLVTLLALWRLFRRERPRIVHTHTSKAGILGRWAAWLAGVPVVIHTPHGHVFWGYFGPAKTRFFIFLEKLSALVTDRLVMLTDQERIDHLRVGIAPEEAFVTIHSGVDLAPFMAAKAARDEARRALGIPDGAFAVGTVGRLTAIKGPGVLVDAARRVIGRHPDSVFVFLGAGELLEALQARAADLGIAANVRFVGWRPDAARLMSALDCFAFPSINEGMGKALVEAMALEKPVVASRVGGIIDLVDDGVNGFLVPAGDPQALAERILFCLENPETARRMARRAAEKAAVYGSAAMVRKIEALYAEFAPRPEGLEAPARCLADP
ncbi:MAG: glycosyltransferase family 4 protein [Syntrophaceae bacterium]|nr:glycosyltransferase family 4 protein [Syntrophaceae bacterium]